MVFSENSFHGIWARLIVWYCNQNQMKGKLCFTLFSDKRADNIMQNFKSKLLIIDGLLITHTFHNLY